MTNRSNGSIKNDMIYGHQHQLKRYLLMWYVWRIVLWY